MTDDRELLELAAKAAGIHCKGWAMQGGRSDGWHGMYTGSDDDGAYLRWNPITDDGDALRLAVTLGIDVIQTNIHSPHVHALADAGVRVWEDSSGDPLAATRRAITRAAAELGRNMT